MEVIEFDKFLLERLEESLNVLGSDSQLIPASRVRSEWAYFLELQIEPTGWQALWKIPRITCEENGIRFPTIVFGTVERVLFKEMQAVFLIEAVQDETIHLPEAHQVALEDLWVTLAQKNQEVNVEKTADGLDQLRFFFKNVWMPWDNDSDDDINWVEKHLESRIRFYYDMQKGLIKRPLAAKINMLLNEAQYIQQKRENIEHSIDDDDDLDVTDSKKITSLMRFHLRLEIIRNEMEMLENPETRRIYEDILYTKKKAAQNNEMREGNKLIYIVLLTNCMQQHITALNQVNAIKENQSVSAEISSSLQHVLDAVDEFATIYLSPGRHDITILRSSVCGATLIGLFKDTDNVIKNNAIENLVILCAANEENALLVWNGDLTLENITLDCGKVRTGIFIKNGVLRMKNCRLFGDGKSITTQGIRLCDKTSSVIMEDCIVENFGAGIVCSYSSCSTNSSIALYNCTISNCYMGIDLKDNSVLVKVHSCIIRGSQRSGIYMDAVELIDTDLKSLSCENIQDFKSQVPTPNLSGECTFEDCKLNIVAFNSENSLITCRTNGVLQDSGDFHAI